MANFEALNAFRIFFESEMIQVVVSVGLDSLCDWTYPTVILYAVLSDRTGEWLRSLPVQKARYRRAYVTPELI